jgi:hypothetical protein
VDVPTARNQVLTVLFFPILCTTRNMPQIPPAAQLYN